MSYEDELRGRFGKAAERCDLLQEGIAGRIENLREIIRPLQQAIQDASETSAACSLVSQAFDSVTGDVLDLGGGETVLNAAAVAVDCSADSLKASHLLMDTELKLREINGVLNQALLLLTGITIYAANVSDTLKGWNPE